MALRRQERRPSSPRGNLTSLDKNGKDPGQFCPGPSHILPIYDLSKRLPYRILLVLQAQCFSNEAI